ncbi:MAG: acyltransferase [Pseudomonadota bacterium]|nr:acyltransferase [Pseudomonadota bacterium]
MRKLFSSTVFTKTHIQDEIGSLTAFRFITAFVIFLSHSSLFLGLKFGVFIVDEFLRNFSIFMTGFFVLSGYILSHLYSERDFTQKDEIRSFYLKRLARLYPVYAVTTFVFFCFFSPFDFTSFDWLRVFINDIFLTQGFFPNVSDLGINCITWSVSVEAFFYLLFPLIMVLFRTRPLFLLLISLLISLIISVNIVGDINTQQESMKKLAFYYASPLFRINEFMLGISFNLFVKKNKFNFIPKILQSIALVMFFILALAISPLSSEKYSHMGANLLLVPLFGLLIINFHHLKRGFFKDSICLRFLGKISYSFYLWQFIAIVLGLVLRKILDISPLCAVMIILPFNIVLSTFSYHFLEEPCRKLILKNFTSKLSQLQYQ